MTERAAVLDEAIAAIRERAKSMSSGGFVSGAVRNATAAYLKDLEKLKEAKQ